MSIWIYNNCLRLIITNTLIVFPLQTLSWVILWNLSGAMVFFMLVCNNWWLQKKSGEITNISYFIDDLIETKHKEIFMKILKILDSLFDCCMKLLD